MLKPRFDTRSLLMGIGPDGEAIPAKLTADGKLDVNAGIDSEAIADAIAEALAEVELGTDALTAAELAAMETPVMETRLQVGDNEDYNAKSVLIHGDPTPCARNDTTLVKAAPGILQRIVIGTAGDANSTVSIYNYASDDDGEAVGDLIQTISGASSRSLDYSIEMTVGILIVVADTGATIDVLAVAV